MSSVETVVELPERLRGELKEPLGPLFTDAENLLARVDGPLIAVGDVVTYHLVTAGVTPDVALVDGKTKREAADQQVRDAASGWGKRKSVRSPAATLSAELLTALGEAIRRDEETVLFVEGEEDLAVLPALLAAPDGASIVYGQPDEGMVHVVVGPETKQRARELLQAMEGNYERLCTLLGVATNE